MPWVVVAVWAAEHADGAPGMVAGVATAPPTGGGAAARGCSSIDIGCTRSFRPATARTLLETVEERVAAPVAARPTVPSGSRYRSRPVWKVPSRLVALPRAVISS